MTGKKGLVSDCFSRQDVNYAHVVSLALGMYYANERKAQCALCSGGFPSRRCSDQISNLESTRVSFSHIHPALYLVDVRAKPVLCGQSSTECNLFDHGTSLTEVSDCLNMLLSCFGE